MNTGQIISGVGHGVVILWVVLGDWLFNPQDMPPVEVTTVSLMTSAEFDAMAAAVPSAPKATDQTKPKPKPEPAPAEPVPAETPPVDPAPPEPAPVEDPLPQDLPVEAVPQPLETPAPTAPLAATEQPIPVPLSDVKPKPRPVDRVAAVPVDSPTDAPEVADTPTPEVTDTPSPDAQVVEEPKPAAAPEEATTQIVTEAVDTADAAPQLPPSASLPPRSRPAKPAPTEAATQTAAAEKPAPKPAADPVADAVAAAVAEAAADTGGSDLPVGPPMTSGEKDAMRVAVQKCWNLGALSMEAMRTTVTIGVSVAQSGVPDAGSISMIGYEGGSDGAARQAFEAARRAIIRCGAKGFPLPPEKYDQWKDMELVFNPEGMRMR